VYSVARPGREDEVVEVSTATGAAVETRGAAAVVSVETDGGSEDGVPEDTVCPRADDDSAAAARTLIRKLFTGRASIQNRPEAPGQKREAS